MPCSSFSRLLTLVVPCLVVAATPVQSAPSPEKGQAEWKSLFDGKTLKGWRITNFGGEGEVNVENGAIMMQFGASLTGVTYQGEFPTVIYEVSLEAKRVDGIDFFCALTFPVRKSHCSLVVGGWEGTAVGISLAAGVIETASSLSPGVIAGGVKVALSTTVFGLALFAVALVAWLLVRLLEGRLKPLPV